MVSAKLVGVRWRRTQAISRDRGGWCTVFHWYHAMLQQQQALSPTRSKANHIHLSVAHPIHQDEEKGRHGLLIPIAPSDAEFSAEPSLVARYWYG